MIRWKFVVTRLLIVVVVLALIGWGLGPIAHYATVRGIEDGIGAKTEIGSTTVGLFPPRVRYEDVRIGDPREGKEFQDIFRADSIQLEIDGKAMLHRRWVARKGRIDGLRVGSSRSTNGHLPTELTPPASTSDGPSMLDRLIGAAGDQIGSQADAIIDDLETARRSKLIKAQWTAEYARLADRAKRLEVNIKQISETVKGIDNPLRDWPELERSLAMGRQAKEDLMEVRAAIDSLPERFQADLASMDEAKQIDMNKVKQYLPESANDSGDVAFELLGGAVKAQVQKIRDYLENGRTIANYTVVKPENERVRGENYDLTDEDRLPEVMIQSCVVNGLMSISGDSYDVSGTVENLTPEPELLVEPTRAKLVLRGPEDIKLEFTRDRRDGADEDLITLHWPQTDAKPMRLGDGDDASVIVDGGNRELWVQLRTVGDQIKGRLVSKQTGLQMNLAVDQKYNRQPAVVALRQSLANVDRLEVDAHFSGTWEDLDVDLSSNIGAIMRRATQDAIEGQVTASKAELATKVENAHLRHTLELRQWVSDQQSQARNLLASADKTIEEMNEKVMSEVGGAESYLGNRIKDTIGNAFR